MAKTAANRGPAQGASARRLLIPVDPTERSRWGVQYAIRQKRCGTPVQAVLLFVSEPVTAPEVLRFRTQAEIARFQAECGVQILHDAAQPLLAAGVACQEIYRQGDIVAEIGDAAEQLACDEIVLPLPHARLAKLLSRDVVREVIKRVKDVAVVTSDAEGVAASATDRWL